MSHHAHTPPSNSNTVGLCRGKIAFVHWRQRSRWAYMSISRKLRMLKKPLLDGFGRGEEGRLKSLRRLLDRTFL